LIVCVAGVCASAPADAQSRCNSVDLEQGWSRDAAEQFWFMSQGSRLVPYAWFLWLEVAEPSNLTLFRDAANIDRYGYLAVAPSPRNPDGLPIGFAKDVGPAGDEHVGLTCAACHTSRLEIAGRAVLVEDGAGLADLDLFGSDLLRALAATATDDAKFDRFAKRVLGKNDPPRAEVQMLRVRLRARIGELRSGLERNPTTLTAGRGRADALARIFARVLTEGLGVPVNAKPPYAPAVSAPVSIPALWDTPHHDLVQWNGSGANMRLLQAGALGRNVGEVLGAFADLEVDPGRRVPYFSVLSRPPRVT
jgi:hypothetical protein